VSRRRCFPARAARVLGLRLVDDPALHAHRQSVRDAGPRLLLLGRGGYDGGVLFAGRGGKEGSCTPQALAVCLNAGDWTSVPLPMAGKYSPGPSVRVATSDTVVSGSGNCENPCTRRHRANVSAARSSAADGSGGPCRCRPTGCSFAQAFSAARKAGVAGLGSAPLDPGSGNFGTPFARMQLAYFTACVPADPELLGLEEEPHAASATAPMASTTRRRAAGLTCSMVRGGA
jgi:hypothetical protein